MRFFTALRSVQNDKAREVVVGVGAAKGLRFAQDDKGEANAGRNSILALDG